MLHIRSSFAAMFAAIYWELRPTGKKLALLREGGKCDMIYASKMKHKWRMAS